MEGGAKRNVAVVDAVGVQNDVGTCRAAAEKFTVPPLRTSSTASCRALGMPTASIAISTPRFFGREGAGLRIAFRCADLWTT